MEDWRKPIEMMNIMGNSMCECGNIRHPGTFAGWNDFDAFLTIVKATPSLSSVPVKVPHSNVGLQENWYQCSKCQTVWRLVEPDPPFTGLWEQVT